MRSELRVVVLLGLAVGAWLLLVPTASADGSGCGIPIFNTDPSTSNVDLDLDCGARNGTRSAQAFMTLLGVGAVAGGDRAWREITTRRPSDVAVGPRSHWE